MIKLSIIQLQLKITNAKVVCIIDLWSRTDVFVRFKDFKVIRLIYVNLVTKIVII